MSPLLSAMNAAERRNEQVQDGLILGRPGVVFWVAPAGLLALREVVGWVLRKVF